MSASEAATLDLPSGPSRPRAHLPAGPTLFFFIRRSKALADPHRVLGVFEELTTRWGQVASFRSGLRERTYIVADPRVGREVFSNQGAFVKYPHHTADLAKLQAMIGKGMLATHTDTDWETHRRSVARDFARRAVIDRYGPVVSRHVATFLDQVAASGNRAVNISELSMQLSGRIMSDILAPGHAFADENFLAIKRTLDQAILEFHRRDFTRRAPRYKAALRHQADRLLQTALQRNHGPEDGLVGRFMADEPSWRTDPASQERLLDRIINMVVAGYETTATTMNWIVHLLAANPREQERLHAEVIEHDLATRCAGEVFAEDTLLQRCVVEAMRLHPALWFNIRYATQEAVIAGHRFVAGSRVMLLPYLINRSAATYRDPDGFRPDRYSDGEPLPVHPFGHGPRVCIGRTLAELEMQGLAAGLVARFRLRPVGEPRPIGGVLLQPDADVLVRCVPR